MKVLIIPGLTLPEVSNDDLERIRAAAGPDAEVRVTGMKAAHDEVADADVVLGLVPESLFARARCLRWVHAIASGVDMFLYPGFRDSEVVLTSEKGLVGPHLADHAFGLLLMLTRQLATAHRYGADAWNHRPEMRRQEIELTGLTLGCVGYGGTGKAMTRRGTAFGMHCRAVDPEPVETTAEVPVVEGVDGFDSLLEESDVVAICCPLTRATRDLFDESAFARMKPTAYLVNVTRGEVMQEQALVNALSERIIRGAALDVAPREPLPADSGLWQLDNVVMTPHTAGASQFRASRNIDRFVRNLAALREDQPLEGVIDKQLGY
ncbi:MAG: D-2-hydroxyacid dehydrogenase [Gammaproteobacteria bacterium]|nr:MAG: D-2-hydroxyacid dehydrogenase [Gammaproteobacteria bacterium]